MDPQSASRRSSEPYSNVCGTPYPSIARLFVGGLAPEVTESQLYNYFRKFGVLTECEIPKTIRSKKKKFGYVSFMHETTAQNVLKVSNHEILGSLIEVEPALSTVEIFHEQLRKSNCKLFVSGDLIAIADPSTIFNEISPFGEVDKVKKLRTDKRSFNSCFVTMKTIADAEYLLEQKSLVLPSLQKVTFKRFVPRGRSDDEDTQQQSEVLGQESNPSRLTTSDSFMKKGSSSSHKMFPQDLVKSSHNWSQIVSSQGIIVRPGLNITGNTQQNGFVNDQSKNRSSGRLPKARLVSLDQIDLQSIQNMDSNLRYNVLPSQMMTTYKRIVLQH